MNPFQEQILDHYKNPRNFGKPTWSPTHTKKIQNLSCGDSIEIFLLIEEEIIKDVAFIGEGCSIAIAATSLLLEDLKGKSKEVAELIELDNLLNIMGIELTTARKVCANLSVEAVKQSFSQDHFEPNLKEKKSKTPESQHNYQSPN
jgi:nitrogen fixation NifU-like protein